MNAEDFDIGELLKMAHSPVRNYVIPGLTSWMIGAPSPRGTVRMFDNERDHQETITPHSHRFNFQCWVLSGSVRNRIWTESDFDHPSSGDLYEESTLRFSGAFGQYEESDDGSIGRWTYQDREYTAGQCYSMKAHEVHSIYFSRGTKVLFFEGPTISDASIILQPFVHGEVIRTFEVKPWMFKRDAT